MNELKPCPFCGNIGSFWSTDQCQTLYATCIFCGARTVDCDTPEEAISAWNRRVDARQLALKTRVCPMCEDCPDGCPVETPKDSRNIVTNADRIRSLSDKELAEIIAIDFTDDKIGYCQNKAKCEDLLDNDGIIPADWCMQCALDWLEQPVKEE